MLKIAVLTGGHWYRVQQFHQLFRSLPEIDAYVQNVWDFGVAPEDERDSYDAFVFFTMQQEPDEKMVKAMNRILDNGQGILILHHAMFAYPHWDLWQSIGSLPKYSRKDVDCAILNQTVHFIPGPVKHPITDGIAPWSTTTEIFTFDEQTSPDCQVILSTDHSVSMKSLAWVKNFQKSRVFCFSPGHDNADWSHAAYRHVLRRGILWCAGRGQLD